MSDVMELKGRKKAQQNVFHRLLSRPDEYVVEQNLSKVSIIHHRVSHCQLCGNNIHYDFLLEHSKYPHKNLYIGSDCFAQFLKEILDKIMPNQAESILRNIELAMERAVEKEKAKVFLETYPNFVADVQSLYQSLYDLLNVYNLWYEFNRNNRMDIFDVIESVKKDLQNSRHDRIG
jgi:superfamily II helicase